MPEGWLSRADVEARFAPYACRLVAEIAPFELWETGWGEPFTVQAENGMYDEWQISRVMTYVIRKTKPPGWPR
jgi:hypothetical protein